MRKEILTDKMKECNHPTHDMWPDGSCPHCGWNMWLSYITQEEYDKINEIKEFAINSDSHDDDLYNMTVLCFNLIQQGAKNRIGGFQLKETYTSHKEAYTCYTNGIIDFSCNTDKAKDFHQYIKKKAKDISNATCKYMDSRRGSQRSNEGQESSR